MAPSPRRTSLSLTLRRRAPVVTPWRGLVVLTMFACAVLRHGWHETLFEAELLEFLAIALLALHAVMLFVAARSVTGDERDSFIKVTRPEQAITLGGLVLLFYAPAVAAAAVMLTLIVTLRYFLYLVQQRSIPPGLVFVGSFIALTAAGTAILKLPAATPPDKPISWLDSFFTTCSAVSQTGLGVRATGEGFTRFGQTVIMIWVEVGALGVIVFGALLASLIGSSFGLRATQTIAEGTEQGGWAGQLSMQRLVTFIVGFTLLCNIAGAAALYYTWPEAWPGMPHDFATRGDRLFHSVFFSVSAFCNAGFFTTPDCFHSMRTHLIPHAIIVPLILLGSVGFPVLEDLVSTAWRRIRGRRIVEGRLVRLNLNTKIVLTAQLMLYAAGFLLIFISEVWQTREPATLAAFDAHFMNVNRSAGFDTVPPADMGLLSILSLTLLMFIGGSPASTAGGIKVMVLAVLILTVIATIRGKPRTTAFGRTLPDDLVRKCAVIFMLSAALVMTTTGILALAETGRGTGSLTEYLFETTSAFGGTGLTLGLTESLSTTSKIAISITMFIGRVGPLALLAGLFSVARRSAVSYTYPTEDVVVY